ncbi:MAG: hypothetical protein R3B45_17475 [Bdellovibrionota bacterium]
MAIEKEPFNEELIRNYPSSNKKVSVTVQPYCLNNEDLSCDEKAVTTYISPYGLEFQTPTEYPQGTLLKINVKIPDYWGRKQKLVEYQRIDDPLTFKVLAKVIKTEEIGKRGRKKLTLVQTVNIDSIDEEVLKSYLQEAK